MRIPRRTRQLVLKIVLLKRQPIFGHVATSFIDAPDVGKRSDTNNRTAAGVRHAALFLLLCDSRGACAASMTALPNPRPRRHKKTKKNTTTTTTTNHTMALNGALAITGAYPPCARVCGQLTRKEN